MENDESHKKDLGTNGPAIASGAEVELQRADVQTEDLKELTDDQLDAIVSAINGSAERGEVIDQLESVVQAVGQNPERCDQANSQDQAHERDRQSQTRFPASC